MKKALGYLATFLFGGLVTALMAIKLMSKTKGEAIKIKVRQFGRSNSVMFPEREKKERKGLFRRKK